jgi:hypothetical protein
MWPHNLGAHVTQRRVLVGIVFVAVALRLVSALFQGNAVLALPGIYDQISYHGLANRVITGYGFSFGEAHWPATRPGEPTAHWSYLYTLYLSGVYALTGGQPVMARVLQAVLAGILHVWLAWRIGDRVFGPTVGLVAAGLSALYLYFVYYAGALITETFFIIGVLWVLDSALRLQDALRRRMVEQPTRRWAWWQWLELGLAFGITVMLRQVFMLFGPVLFGWLWWVGLRQGREGKRSRGSQTGHLLVGTLLSMTIMLAMILPWTLRNQRVFGVFVPLNTNSGYAFFWGNNPIYGTKFVGILPEDGPSYYDLIPPELLPLNEAELDRELLKRGVQFVFDDPMRYLLLSASRTLEYFKFWPSPQSGMLSNVVRVASFGLLLPFMVYGIWRASRYAVRPTAPHQQAAILLLFGFCLTYTMIHLLTWALIRYRLPVDAVLLIFAALGIVTLLERVARGTRLASGEHAEAQRLLGASEEG